MRNQPIFLSLCVVLVLATLAASPGCSPLTSPESSDSQNRPTTFQDFQQSVQWLKRSIYLIARGRRSDENNTWAWTTLGTAFIAAPYRMITASHVIENPFDKNEMAHHKTGDIYYLLRNDSDTFHFRAVNLELNQELFLYPQIDVAVIYLDDEFYRSGASVGLSKDDYIRIDTQFAPIGASVGVLGYPLSQLKFAGANIKRPQVSDIILRADAGFINTRYKTATQSQYEFTMAFNPGNSGGPIFDLKTGKLVAIVNGYRAIPIRFDEKIIPRELVEKLQYYQEKSYIDVLHATYSVGTATATKAFIEMLKTHTLLK